MVTNSWGDEVDIPQDWDDMNSDAQKSLPSGAWEQGSNIPNTNNNGTRDSAGANMRGSEGANMGDSEGANMGDSEGAHMGNSEGTNMKDSYRGEDGSSANNKSRNDGISPEDFKSIVSNTLKVIEGARVLVRMSQFDNNRLAYEIDLDMDSLTPTLHNWLFLQAAPTDMVNNLPREVRPSYLLGRLDPSMYYVDGFDEDLDAEMYIQYDNDTNKGHIYLTIDEGIGTADDMKERTLFEVFYTLRFYAMNALSCFNPQFRRNTKGYSNLKKYMSNESISYGNQESAQVNFSYPASGGERIEPMYVRSAVTQEDIEEYESSGAQTEFSYTFTFSDIVESGSAVKEAESILRQASGEEDN